MLAEDPICRIHQECVLGHGDEVAMDSLIIVNIAHEVRLEAGVFCRLKQLAEDREIMRVAVSGGESCDAALDGLPSLKEFSDFAETDRWNQNPPSRKDCQQPIGPQPHERFPNRRPSKPQVRCEGLLVDGRSGPEAQVNDAGADLFISDVAGSGGRRIHR